MMSFTFVFGLKSMVASFFSLTIARATGKAYDFRHDKVNPQASIFAVIPACLHPALMSAAARMQGVRNHPF